MPHLQVFQLDVHNSLREEWGPPVEFPGSLPCAFGEPEPVHEFLRAFDRCPNLPGFRRRAAPWVIELRPASEVGKKGSQVSSY